MEPEAGSVDALDEGVGMGFGDRVFGHFITNGMLSLAAFLCVSCSLATIVIDESIEHGASIPAITDWYWDLESVVFDEPLGPWDGTYEGNATPYGEPEELFDEQNNSITVTFQTLPNGDSIACGGAVVKMRIYGERVSGTVFDEDGWGYQISAKVNESGFITNGTASGFENNGTWFGTLSWPGSGSYSARGGWADEYGCEGYWEVISLETHTNNCTTGPNDMLGGMSNQTGNNTDNTTANGTNASQSGGENQTNDSQSGGENQTNASQTDVTNVTNTTDASTNQTRCPPEKNNPSLLNNPLVKPIAKALMGEPFESEPDPSGETGETAGQVGIIAGAVGARALVKAKKKKDKAVKKEAKAKKREAKARRKKAKDAKKKEAKAEEKRSKKESTPDKQEASFWGDFWDGVKKDITGLGNDLADLAQGAVDTVEEAARLATDPQFYKDFAKGSAEDIVNGSDYIMNKMDTDDIKAVAKKGAEVAGNAAKFIAENPGEVVKMLTPIGDIEDGMDPNKSLGQRLVSMGTAVVDVVGTIASGGATKGAKAVAKLVQTKKVDAVKDAKKAAELSSGLDTADDLKKFGKVEQGPVVHSTKGAPDVQKSSETIEDRPIPSKENIEQRKEAWKEHQVESEKLVQRVGEALDSGDSKIITKELNEIKSNKVAMNRVNSKLRDDQKIAFQKHTDELHAKVDGDVREYAQKRFDFGEMEGPFQTSTGKVWWNPKTGAEFRTVESTNPVGAVKIGSDRDITYRVVKPDENGKRLMSDIDHREVRPTYDKSYHKHANAKELGYGEDPATFAKNQDQMVTDAKHSEAYGRSQKEGQAILEGKVSEDSQLLGDTTAYKADHWINKGSTGGGLEDNTFEGMRQLSKQQATRFKPLEDELRRLNPNHHLLKESSYERLNSKKYPILDEMKKLQENPYGAGVKSPVEIEMMIHDAGFANVNEFNHMVGLRTTTFEQALRYERGGL